MTDPLAQQDFGLFVRVKPRISRVVSFSIDGHTVTAHAGDTVLSALLLHTTHVRNFEFAAGNRAGFCLMGACQECWVRLAGGGRVRACTTLLSDGLAVVIAGGSK